MTPAQINAAKQLANMRRARNLLAREEINAHKLIDEIEQLKTRLTDCEPEDIQRLLAIANINFNLLKKVMPDMKPIEQPETKEEAVVVNIDSSKYEEMREKALAHNDV